MSRGGRTHVSKVGVRGEAIVYAGGSEAYADYGITLGEPSGEFGADAGLQIDPWSIAWAHGLALRFASGAHRKILRSDDLLGEYGIGEMDVGGTVARSGNQVVDGGDYARGIEMPFDQEAVGGHAAMEGAGGNAIEIGDVTARDGAETVEVEVRVFGLEGIERPLDETNATAEGVFALKEFELTADAAIAMGRENGGHVGMEIGGVIVKPDEGFAEADHEVTIESAENLATGVVGDDVGDVGFGVEFGVGPNFAGDLNATVEFVERVERTDGDVYGHDCCPIYVSSFWIWVKSGRRAGPVRSIGHFFWRLDAGVADLKVGQYTRKRTHDGGVKPPDHGQLRLGDKTLGLRSFVSLRRTVAFLVVGGRPHP
jgi:hypothetical protein